MKILIFILELIVAIALYVTINIYAEKNNKDLFKWGYLTGAIMYLIFGMFF